ncbi:uncharacterized protein LOC133458029 isoform X2 [Cololabis saira]|uniref:uncharacterized protein LOC133458029 isoform X2 n=1 Tax=Cololabis saira TaxID=129043 RepID=UPI002AD5B3D3|nr:uncharacterized protein LOC133458029 isoform X2 [Cololabis saira]
MEAAHQLSCSKDVVLDIYDSLWVNNQDIAEQTLKTPFLQHMQSGDLQADYYVTFTIQDINYLVKVTDMLKTMSERGDMPDYIHAFMKARYKSYKNYADDTLKQFNLCGVSDIKPIPAMEKYLSDYKDIMEREEPIYSAVSLLPCARLWIWLASKLEEKKQNAYFTWKNNNMQGHPEKEYRKLLDDHLKTPQQVELAHKIFRRQMQNEHDFFAASFQEKQK